MGDKPQPQPEPEPDAEGEHPEDTMTPEERLANHERLQELYPNTRLL